MDNDETSAILPAIEAEEVDTSDGEEFPDVREEEILISDDEIQERLISDDDQDARQFSKKRDVYSSYNYAATSAGIYDVVDSAEEIDAAPRIPTVAELLADACKWNANSTTLSEKSTIRSRKQTFGDEEKSKMRRDNIRIVDHSVAVEKTIFNLMAGKKDPRKPSNQASRFGPSTRIERRHVPTVLKRRSLDKPSKEFGVYSDVGSTRQQDIEGSSQGLVPSEIVSEDGVYASTDGNVASKRRGTEKANEVALNSNSWKASTDGVASKRRDAEKPNDLDSNSWTRGASSKQNYFLSNAGRKVELPGRVLKTPRILGRRVAASNGSDVSKPGTSGTIHACTLCPWQCEEKSELERHFKIYHRDEVAGLCGIPPKPIESAYYQRNICAADNHACFRCKLTKIQNLDDHINQHHPDWIPCLFSLCTAWFDSSADRAKHLLSSHPPEIVKLLPPTALAEKPRKASSPPSRVEPNSNEDEVPPHVEDEETVPTSTSPPPARASTYSLRRRKDNNRPTVDEPDDADPQVVDGGERRPKKSDRVKRKMDSDSSGEDWAETKKKKSPQRKRKRKQLVSPAPSVECLDGVGGGNLEFGFDGANPYDQGADCDQGAAYYQDVADYQSVPNLEVSNSRRLHPKTKQCKCYICGCRLISDAALATHVQLVHPNSPVRCLVCRRWFLADNLRHHVCRK